MIRAFNLGLVLFLIWFLNVSFQEKQLNNISANEILGTEDTPDFYSEDLQIRQYNDQGKLESYITTKRLSHYVDKQYAILDAPQLMLYGKDGSVKNISSTYGELACIFCDWANCSSRFFCSVVSRKFSRSAPASPERPATRCR